jgi:hypothetical protein
MAEILGSLHFGFSTKRALTDKLHYLVSSQLSRLHYFGFYICDFASVKAGHIIGKVQTFHIAFGHLFNVSMVRKRYEGYHLIFCFGCITNPNSFNLKAKFWKAYNVFSPTLCKMVFCRI